MGATIEMMTAQYCVVWSYNTVLSGYHFDCCLAAGGLRDNKLHTTAICSPTHASLAART
jgi:hypothetical protein